MSTTTSKVSKAELVELIASSCIDDCCDANTRFVGRPELVSELAAECVYYVDSQLQNNSDLLTYGTRRQIEAAMGWRDEVIAQVYLQLGVSR
jgi:hypothetical protein